MKEKRVDEGLKKRLIGATVLVSLVVIFVPMLLEKEPVVSTDLKEDIIPDKPEVEFSSKLLPLETEDLSQPTLEEPVPIPVPAQEEANVVEDTKTVKNESKPSVKPKQTMDKKADPDPRVGLSGWVVQVGSFSKRDNAEKLVNELRAKKYAAFTDQVDLKGNILHRVLIGPEVDKKNAEQLLVKLNKLLQSKKLAGKIKRYQ